METRQGLTDLDWTGLDSLPPTGVLDWLTGMLESWPNTQQGLGVQMGQPSISRAIYNPSRSLLGARARLALGAPGKASTSFCYLGQVGEVRRKLQHLIYPLIIITLMPRAESCCYFRISYLQICTRTSHWPIFATPAGLGCSNAPTCNQRRAARSLTAMSPVEAWRTTLPSILVRDEIGRQPSKPHGRYLAQRRARDGVPGRRCRGRDRTARGTPRVTVFPGSVVRVSCGETATLQRSRWLAACLLLRATAIRTLPTRGSPGSSSCPTAPKWADTSWLSQHFVLGRSSLATGPRPRKSGAASPL